MTSALQPRFRFRFGLILVLITSGGSGAVQVHCLRSRKQLRPPHPREPRPGSRYTRTSRHPTRSRGTGTAVTAPRRRHHLSSLASPHPIHTPKPAQYRYQQPQRNPRCLLRLLHSWPHPQSEAARKTFPTTLPPTALTIWLTLSGKAPFDLHNAGDKYVRSPYEKALRDTCVEDCSSVFPMRALLV